MIGACQFCKELFQHDIRPLVCHHDLAEGLRADCPFCRPDREMLLAQAYGEFARAVCLHMMLRHEGQCLDAINDAMQAAGSAVAMRYVAAADNQLDGLRISAADVLCQSLRAVPSSPLLSSLD
jgi:hypothetical protein